ncbi:MAG: HNH endonuclease, partial [Chloroflexi bacterium]
VTRVLLSANSQVIDVGRTTRKIPPATRRALDARDKGCRWPGCDRIAAWTSGHHMQHWSKGGATALPNLVLLCHRHHWLVHEGRWQIVRGEDDQFVVVPPQPDFLQHLARGPDVGAVA